MLDTFCIDTVILLQFVFVFLVVGCSKQPEQNLSDSGTEKKVVQTTSNTAESISIDVSDVYRGGTVSRVFVYENKSGTKQTIAEQGIKKSCTCSSLTVDKHVLEAGEKAEIQMSVALGDKYGHFDETGSVAWKAVNESVPIQRFFIRLSGNAVSGFELTPNTLMINKDDVLAKTKFKIAYKRMIDMEGAEVHSRLGHQALVLNKKEMTDANNGYLLVSVKPELVNDTIYTAINIWSHVQDQYSGNINTIMGSVSVRIEYPEIIKCINTSLKVRKIKDSESGYKGYLMFRGNLSNIKIPELTITNKQQPIPNIKFDVVKIANVVYRLDIEIPQKPEEEVDREQCRLRVKLSSGLELDLPVDFQ
jgi:hypothetical protein